VTLTETAYYLPAPPNWSAGYQPPIHPGRGPVTDPGGPGVGTGSSGSWRAGSPDTPGRPRCAARVDNRMIRPHQYSTPEDQRCFDYALRGDPNDLCRRHRNYVDENKRVYLVTGGSVPEETEQEPAPNAEVIRFPVGVRHNVDLFSEEPEERREWLEELRNRLIQGIATGVSEAERLLHDPRTSPHLKLKATEVLLKFGEKTGVLREVQEVESDRNLDAEITAIVESLDARGETELPAAGDDRGDAQIIEWAAARGYKVKYANNEEAV
jgi:hypothetical protein